MRVRAPSQNKIKRKTRSFCCSRLKNEEMKDERRRQNEEKRSEKSFFFKTVVVVSKKEEKDRNFDTLKTRRSQTTRKSGGLRRISSPLVAINVVENADLDPEPFFLFNSSSKLNFLRSRHVSIVAKVFEILSPKKSRAGVA